MSASDNKKKRQFLSGVAVLATSLAATVGAADAGAATTPSINSANPQSQADFVIASAQSSGPTQFQHESHASHASHESHASHASHASHYSSAG